MAKMPDGTLRELAEAALREKPGADDDLYNATNAKVILALLDVVEAAIEWDNVVVEHYYDGTIEAKLGLAIKNWKETYHE